MDTVTLIGRLLVSLAVVLGVVWLIARRMRKTGAGKANGLIEVLDRRQLSRTSSVAVVRVGEQALVIGVTDNQVSVLGETDIDQARAATASVRPAPRALTTQKAQKQPRSAASRHRNAAKRPAVRAAVVATATVDAPDGSADGTETPTLTTPGTKSRTAATSRTPLAGSALSPQTWKQTIESLREMTAR